MYFLPAAPAPSRTSKRTHAPRPTRPPATSHILFRRSVCCGSEGDCRLGMDHRLFLTRCSCHSGTRSSTHGRADQSSFATPGQSADECTGCRAATYFGYVAFGVALALSAKPAG